MPNTLSSCNEAVDVQMIVHPEERVADFAKAGSDIISVHAEPAATVHLDRTIQQVQTEQQNIHPPLFQLYALHCVAMTDCTVMANCSHTVQSYHTYMA